MTHRKLGVFVLGVAAIQAALYATVAIGGDAWTSLFYFDPRIGWFFLETIVRQQEQFPSVSSWLTAGGTALLGVMLVLRREWITVYLVAETVIALPTLAMFVLIIAANMSPSHGFSVGELIIPVPIFLAVSVTPLTLAWRLRKS